MINSRDTSTSVDQIVNTFFAKVPEIQTVGWSQGVFNDSPKLVVTPVVGSFDTLDNINKRCGRRTLVEYMEFWSDNYSKPSRKPWMSEAEFQKFDRVYTTRCAILGSEQRIIDIRTSIYTLNSQLGNVSTKLLKQLFGPNASILIGRDKIRVDKTVLV